MRSAGGDERNGVQPRTALHQHAYFKKFLKDDEMITDIHVLTNTQCCTKSVQQSQRPNTNYLKQSQQADIELF